MAYAADLQALSMSMMSGGQYDEFLYAGEGDVTQPSSVESRQMDNGTRPKDNGARPKEFKQPGATSGSSMSSTVRRSTAKDYSVHYENEVSGGARRQSGEEMETFRCEGNNRKVALEQCWKTAVCRVSGQGQWSEFAIHQYIHPCKLQYVATKKAPLPKDVKLSDYKPGVLNIEMEKPGSYEDVINLFRKALVDVQITEFQFTSEDEFVDVVCYHLDQVTYNRLFFSSGTLLLYIKRNASFEILIVGPNTCSVFKDFQNTSKQISLAKKAAQHAALVDNLTASEMKYKHTKKVTHPSERLNAFLTLGVFDDLNGAFTFDFRILKDEILFSCENERDLEDITKELRAYDSRLKMIPVNLTLVQGKELFLNVSERKEKYLKTQLNCSHIKFIEERNKFVLMCISTDGPDTIFEAFKNCFHHTIFPSEILSEPMVQQYLIKKNPGDIFLFSEGKTSYCFAMRYVQERIKTINLSFLPVEAWCFLSTENEQRDTLIREKLGISDFKFLVVDANGIVLLCISDKDGTTLFTMAGQCFNDKKIQSKKLEHPKIQQMLNEYRDQFCLCKMIEKPNFTHMHFMQNMVNITMEFDNHHGSPCDKLTLQYLGSHGSELVKSLEQEHGVTLTLSDRYIEFTGDNNASLVAAGSMEERLHTVVHQVNTDELKVMPDDWRQHLQQIANNNKCCVKTVPTKTEKRPADISKVEGAQYLTTWVLKDLTSCVSIVCGDLKHMKLDALIIPVNTSLFSESLLSEGIQPLSKILRVSGGHTSVKKSLGEVLEGSFLDKAISSKWGYGIAVTSTEMIDGKEQHVNMKSKDLRSSMDKVYNKCLNRSYVYNNIGLLVPQDQNEFYINLLDIIKPFLTASQMIASSKPAHLHLFVRSSRERWIQKVNRDISEHSHRRIVGPEISGLLNSREDLKVNISDKSLLDIQTDCLVVSVGNDFNLRYGFVAKLVYQQAGPELQDELTTAHQLDPGRMIIATRPWRLSNLGVKLLLFVVVPHWSKCGRSTQILQMLVEDCLLLADNYYCKSVAFPVFGIGNLDYPKRDVSVALLDAIDIYQKEATLQNISQIFISAPAIKNDNTILQLFCNERGKRLSQQQIENYKKQEDIECLRSGKDNVEFSVFKEGTETTLIGGEFVQIQFDTNKVSGESLSILWTSMYVLTVSCGKSKDDLKKALEQIVYFCENNRITSILVSTHSGFTFSESDQLNIIAETVNRTVYKFDINQYPSREYKYLKTVFISVSRAFTFSVEALNTVQSSSWITTRSAGQHIPVWKLIKFPGSVSGMNLVVMGDSDDVCRKTVKDIDQFLMTGDQNEENDQFVDAKEELSDENANKTDSSEQIIGKGIEAKEYWRTAQSKSDNQSIEMFQANYEVTAQLNPGLVTYLLSLHLDEYEKWKLSAFGKYLVTLHELPVNDSPHPVIIVGGQFDNILAFEQHIENDFTMADPQLEDDKTVTAETSVLVVPMSQQDAERIMKRKMVDMVNRYGLEGFRIVKEGIEIKCRSQDESTIHKKVKEWVKALPKTETFLQKFDVNEVRFKFRKVEIDVMNTDITNCDVDCIVSSVNSDMNCDYGVAKHIALKVGKEYKDFCKKGSLDVSECKLLILDSKSKMKFKGILNVNAFPAKGKGDVDREFLEEVRKAVTNCFSAAEQQGYKSIALPMLRTGRQSNLQVSLCAQECFRAVDACSFKSLTKVVFVCKESEKVEEFIKELAKTSSSNSDQATMVPTFISLKQKSFKTHIYMGTLYQPECEGIVEFKSNMRKKDKPLEDRIVCFAKGPGYLIQVPTPEDDTETLLQETVRCILKKAKCYSISSVAIPTLAADGNMEVKDGYMCEVMFAAVYEYCTKHPRAMDTVQIVPTRQEMSSWFQRVFEDM